MALIAHQTQGSYATYASRSLLWTKGVKLKPFVAIHFVGRIDRSTSLKCRSCLSIGAPHIFGPKRKSLKISAFKGNAQNGESGSRGSKLPKNPVKLSYVPHEGDETITKFPEIQKVPLSYTSEEGESRETVAGSPAIQKLFRKWLMMLRTQSSGQTADEIFGDGPPQGEILENQTGSQKQEAVTILKAAWCYFLGLDSMVKIPLLIFVPLYLAVNILYGADVSKELTPFWVLGPLVVALYIKLLQGLCALYVFTFKQTVKVVRNLPTFYFLAYNYVAQGKLKKELSARFWQPVVDIKNLDYKELSKKKRKEFEEWAMDKYLDYVESIWPYYCRTIRFLKKANLI